MPPRNIDIRRQPGFDDQVVAIVGDLVAADDILAGYEFTISRDPTLYPEAPGLPGVRRALVPASARNPDMWLYWLEEDGCYMFFLIERAELTQP